MKRTFTDAETQAILARALEIDAQSPDGLGTEQLASIAAELGISPSALEKAIGEHGGRAVAVNAPPAAVPAFKGGKRSMGILAVAAIVALLAIAAITVSRRTLPPQSPPSPPRVQPPMPGKAIPPPKFIPADQPPPPTKTGSHPKKQPPP